MPSDSVTALLDRAVGRNLLPRERMDELFAEPDAPQANAGAACDFLERRGALTPDQANQLRTGESPKGDPNLEEVIAEIGPMPGPLAAGYARQIANSLVAIHAQGLAHGAVRPATATVGPMVATTRPKPDGTPRMRPSPKAVVTLAESGQPMTGDYSAPEQPNVPTAAGDVYSLGTTLFHLLTGRAPKHLETLSAMRPDLPKGLAGLVKALTAEKPEERPTMAEAADALRAVAEGRVPSQLVPDSEEVKLETAPPSGVHGSGALGMELIPDDYEHQPAAGDWLTAPAEFVPDELSNVPMAEPAKHPSKPEEEEKPKRSNRKALYMWLGIGLLFQIMAVVIWYFVIRESSTPEPDNTPAPKKAPVKPKKPGAS